VAAWSIHQISQRISRSAANRCRRPTTHVVPVRFQELNIHTIQSVRVVSSTFMLTPTKKNLTRRLQRYTTYIDPYHNIMRLDLFRFDGSPVMPLYLAYKPPMMLPTTTLNPTTSSTAPGSHATGKSSKFKRWIDDEATLPMNHKVLRKRQQPTGWADADRWWWIGVFMTGLGSVLYFCF
jgi:hypothetical protein